MTYPLVLLAFWPPVFQGFQDDARRKLEALHPEIRAAVAEAMPGVRWTSVEDGLAEFSNAVELFGIDDAGHEVTGHIAYRDKGYRRYYKGPFQLWFCTFQTKLPEADLPEAVRRKTSGTQFESWTEHVSFREGRRGLSYYASAHRRVSGGGSTLQLYIFDEKGQQYPQH